MTGHDDDATSDGLRAAQQAIAQGVPRWVVTGPDFDDQPIHAETGLPIANLSSPAELAAWQVAFARGFNQEIMRGIESGRVSVNFKPLLMSLDEVKDAFVLYPLGALSVDCPRIDDPRGRFAVYLQFPKPPKTHELTSGNSQSPTWIVFEHTPGDRYPQFGVYDGAVDLALGQDGRVLLMKTNYLYLASDVETTQVLHRYSRS